MSGHGEEEVSVSIGCMEGKRGGNVQGNRLGFCDVSRVSCRFASSESLFSASIADSVAFQSTIISFRCALSRHVVLFRF